MPRGTKVFTGLEGLITPDQLRRIRRTASNEAFIREQKRGGVQGAAETAGRLLGEVFARNILPDEQAARAQATQRAVDTATNAVEQHEFVDADFADIDKRIAITQTAIRELETAGLSSEARQLGANLEQLRNSRLERRIELAKLQGTQADTARTQQLTKFDELGEAVTVTLLDGSVADPLTVMQRPDGTIAFTDPNTGVDRELNPGQFAEVRVQGGTADVAPDRAKLRDAQKQFRGLNGAIETMTLMRQSIVDDPTAGTFTGAVAAGLNRIANNARIAVQRDHGSEAIIANRSTIESKLSELGVEDAVARARASNLAFAIATSREGGRLTDQDVERAAIAAGIGQSDPAARIAVLDDLASTMEDGFNFLIEDESIAALPQVGVLQRKFAGFKNHQRDFSVNIPGRTQENPTAPVRQVTRTQLTRDANGNIVIAE